MRLFVAIPGAKAAVGRSNSLEVAFVVWNVMDMRDGEDRQDLRVGRRRERG